MEEEDTTLYSNIWLRYNSLRLKYKPKKVHIYNSLHEITPEEFRSLLFKATRRRLQKHQIGFLKGISKKYHYYVQHEWPFQLTERQFNFLKSMS